MKSALLIITIVLVLLQRGRGDRGSGSGTFRSKCYATVGKLGELLSATEGYDNAPLDVQMPKNPKSETRRLPAVVACSGAGPTATRYFSSDVRGRIIPGQAKRWQGFRVWRMPSSGTNALNLMWFPDPTYAPTATISGKPASYRLTVTGSQTVSGAPAVGAVFQLTPGQSGSVLLPMWHRH